MREAISLEDVTAAEVPELVAALRAAGLPADDVTVPGQRVFRARHDRGGNGGGGERASSLGFVGLEPCGPDAVLRSLVVPAPLRGRGIGTAIVEAALRRAAALGFRRLFVLTTAAPGFFEKLGFERIDRGSVPVAVAETAAFAKLCPPTAVCLTRSVAA